MTSPASQTAAFIAEHPQFNLRCQLIALQYAVNWVLAEDLVTANHANRIAFATKVINGAIPATLLARVALTDQNIQAAAIADASNAGSAVADQDIDGRIQAMWNALANALVG